MKILMADDDADFVDVTAYALRRAGFDVIVATDGVQALRRWQSDTPDLVLLDVSMPHLSGLDVCRRIRQSSPTPVIMLTAAGDEEHVVQGFRHGADDYVTKPFSAKQLTMRIRAVLNRVSGKNMVENTPILQVGNLTLDVESHQVTKEDTSEPVQLTRLEFRILYMLAMNYGRVVSFSRLVEYAWGYDGGEPSMLKTHVSHIRSKIGMKPKDAGSIGVVHGVGYILNKGAA
ncbi:MAG: response regulator transcription factor [Chloroflexi bacterium]|nr:response regulator transcription factor [Chloroflexota bacterium]